MTTRKGFRSSPEVGFIGGGQMAQALSAGFVAAGLLEQEDCMFSLPDADERGRLSTRFPEATVSADNADVFQRCEKVFLAVKPHVLKAIAGELAAHATANHLVISIAAGIALEQLEAWFPASRVIRVMPNTPVQVGVGAAGLSAPESAREEDVAWTMKMLSAVGTIERVPDDLMHAVTGVAGSSPAYIYMIIEALSDGGVAMGLPRATATRLAAAAVEGAAKMVLETGQHPGQLKDQVTSPGGTTIEAVRCLEAAGIRSGMIEAVARCSERSRELG